MDRVNTDTAFANMYMKFKDSGFTSNEAFEKIQKMGYTKTQRTMDRHVASVRSTGHAVSPVKRDGKESLLNDAQMAEVDAWVLSQNNMNCPIGYSDVQQFIYDTFGIEVCIRTAGNVLERLGHTKKTCQSKNGGHTKSND